MEGLCYFYTPHLRQNTQPFSQNLFKPVIQIHVSSENDSQLCSVSPADLQNTSATDRKIPRVSPALLDEADMEMEAIIENESSGLVDQDDGVKQISQNSISEPPLTKPIRSYMDESLPDLLRSGSPLRRRVSSPVSDTLKQMRREVELSRRRSLKIKAQVDKLQEESQDGLVWSQHRDRVTEEIQSIVKLLHPLTDLTLTNPPTHKNSLDEALLHLRDVARTIALNQASQGKTKSGNTDEEISVLQQALRDRDEALAKKKAMETELLKCKTELMSLNNQLLEAVQRRLEMAIELEAWKDDMQAIIHHQVLSQQQAEQNQKKSRGFGVLRRSKVPSPAPSPSPSQSRASTPVSQAPNTPVAQRWKEKLRRGRNTQQRTDSPEQPPSPEAPDTFNSKEDSFQTVSLD